MFNTLKLGSESLCFFLILLSLAICQTQGGDAKTLKQNILFIVTDQQRYDSIRRVQDELSFFCNGKLKIRTPNLDRLSREGVYFRTAYTQSPVCGAARTVRAAPLNAPGCKRIRWTMQLTNSILSCFRTRLTSW